MCTYLKVRKSQETEHMSSLGLHVQRALPSYLSQEEAQGWEQTTVGIRKHTLLGAGR